VSARGLSPGIMERRRPARSRDRKAG
jgi:hypothetical protein